MINKTFSRFILLLTLIVLLCATSAAQQTQEPITAPSYFFPPIGGVRGEVLRFSVVSPPSFRMASPTCQTTLSFADLEGRPVGPSREVRLAMGESAFVDLDFNTLVAGSGMRAEVRPVLTAREGSGPCIPSAEIFEPISGDAKVGVAPLLKVVAVFGKYEDGATTTSDVGIEAYNAGGIVGGSKSQMIRFELVRLTPLRAAGTPFPCRGEMGFRDSRGNAVGPARWVDLAPGQATFLDLNLNTLVSNLGERVGITPVFSTTPDDSKGCVCSIQVVDQFSGRTTVYYGNAVIPPADSQ